MYTILMPKSIAQLKRALSRIQKERNNLHRSMLDDRDMAVGSVSVVEGTCGKSACHCASGKTGHPQTLFLFKGPDGRRRCKLIRQEDSDRLLMAHKNYADFRNNLRELRHLSRQEQAVALAVRKKRSLNYK
jgi:hypothetical protein